MGQSASRPTPSAIMATGDSIADAEDHTSSLPDECLALIFHSLVADDRNRCSLVCKRWLTVDAFSRHRLSLTATPEFSPHIPPIFSRFNSVTHLTLRRLTDDDLISLSPHCNKITEITFSSCSFGIKAFNSAFQHFRILQKLSIKQHHCDEPDLEPILGFSNSLKSIRLKDLKNGLLFAPLVIGATKLLKLKLVRCAGDWDSVVESLINSNDRIIKIHLESLLLTDAALSSVSNCAGLEALDVLDLPLSTSLGIVWITEKCKKLRRLMICCSEGSRMDDEGLAAIGINMNCTNLEQLHLAGVNPTIASLEVIASSCPNLNFLGFIKCKTIRDSELAFLAGKCKALEALLIYGCPISDVGLTSVFWGFPKLKVVAFVDCAEVSQDILHWLKMQRESMDIWSGSNGNDGVRVSTSNVAQRSQGSVWNVMLLCYILGITPRQ